MKDKQLAKQWIQRAARQGYAPAQQALQHMSSQQTSVAANIQSSPNEDSIINAIPGPNKQHLEQPTSKAMSTTSSQEPSAGLSTESKAATMGVITSPHTEATRPMPMTEPQIGNQSPTQVHTTGGLSAPAATITEPAVSEIKGTDWIAAQDSQQFTLQLSGFSNEAAAIRFIRKNHLEAQSAYYSTMRAGRPWFAVIYGRFSNRDAAHYALERLPSALRSASPWIRSFHEIQMLVTP